MRIATWNVHGARGLDGRRSIDRIADVIERLGVDAVALQELDIARPRSGGVDQPRAIALRLGMSHVFGAAIRDGDTAYGNAILARAPLKVEATEPLPCSAGVEPRSLLAARVTLDDGCLVRVITTHLGLVASDRHAQLDALRAFIDRDPVRTIVLGDMNASPKDVANVLGHGLAPAEVPRSFPSIAPVLRLDHVFVTPDLAVEGVSTPRHFAARIASDHLPIVAQIRVILH